MNNDLEQFSEERLKEIAMDAYEADFSCDEIEALARIALAAKQAKPVAWTLNDSPIGLNSVVTLSKSVAKSWNDKGRSITQLFSTPQPAHTEQDGWIECSERIPESKGEFAVYETLNNRVQHDYWVPDDCAAQGKGFWNHYGNNVTHWMPLPQPPKES